APLPDGRFLVTEKAGTMRIVSGQTLSPPVEGLPQVTVQEISGLDDVALDPDFASNQRIYWSYVEKRPAGNVLAVARGRLVDGPTPRVEDVKVIYRQEPDLKSEHGNFGARLLFDKEGMLFVTLGDLASDPLRPYIQQLDSGIGKIVRITPDGAPAPGGPFAGQAGARPELYALGFRNPLGLAFRPGTDELWEVDVGPFGGDELNRIKPGGNYGWPVINYGLEYSRKPVGEGAARAGLEQPVYFWDPVISPSSLAFYTGDMFPQWKGNAFVTSLSQAHLVRLVLDGDKVVGEERLLADRRERLRLVRQAPDGALYVLTDGLKGKLLRVTPAG
ncbi:MAG TPA: PQQ-dependent sugar dehydrogenase, partial [Croceibacterium sp.]